MEIQRIVPWISRYAEELDAWKLKSVRAESEERWMQRAEGKFWIQAKLHMEDDPSVFLRASEQKNAAEFVGRILKQQAEFFRREECYCIGDWSLTNCSITSAPFRIDSRRQCLRVFADLDSAGYRFTDAIGIHYHPKSVDPMKLRALLSYAGAGELTQLREVFGFSGGPTILLDTHGIEMIFSMSKFRYEALEICLLMFDRLIRMSGLLRTEDALCEQ